MPCYRRLGDGERGADHGGLPAESVFLTLTPAQSGKPSPAAGFGVGDAKSGSTERWRLPSERARGAIAPIYRILAE